MRQRARSVIDECRRIAAMTEEPGRITRRFLTPPVRDVHAHLRQRMLALGMTVQIDGAGNLRGLWQPGQADVGRLYLGSHIDTVPNAGPFDGVLGVALALEWVTLAQHIDCPFSIEILAFSEEEGVRFGVPFLGSRAVAGRFDAALLSLKDAQGLTVENALRRFGLDPATIAAAEAEPDALGFVEIHIEQGPVLEADDASLAVVTSIVGQTRLSLEFAGEANHAGTTPMHLRKDALTAAAEWSVAVETYASRVNGLVATVGQIAVEPNATNVIPGKARVSLDVRHASDPERAAAVDALIEQAEKIAARRGLALSCIRQLQQPAVPMDERLSSFLTDALESAGLPPKTMPSGAGHDAMVMASRMPAAMLFLRSPGGLSHHPDEAVREEDVEAALQVGRLFLLRLAGEVRFAAVR